MCALISAIDNEVGLSEQRYPPCPKEAAVIQEQTDEIISNITFEKDVDYFNNSVYLSKWHNFTIQLFLFHFIKRNFFQDKRHVLTISFLLKQCFYRECIRADTIKRP